MNDWVVHSLSELVSFQKGRKVITSPFPLSGYEPYLGAGALSGNNDGYACSTFAVKANEEDVLMLWDGERSGLCCSGLNGVVSSTVCKLTPKKDIRSDLLYYLLVNKYQWIQSRRTGTGVPHVPRDLGRILHIKYPKCLSIQKKIADILKTVDQAIENTNFLINKYQKIKAGMMYDLFTRGVDSNGRLRQTRGQQPDLYKKTSIGWIPKEWDVQQCSQLCSRITVGIVIQPTKYYVEEGVPAFRSANVREDGLDPYNLVYISPFSNALLSKSQIKTGDILSVRTGYPGTSAVVPDEFNGCNCIDILISSPKDSVDKNYLCFWINSSFGKEQVLRLQGGMAQQHFNVGEMRQLLVAVPSINEQIIISDKLMACSSKIKNEKEILNKLIRTKSGLMHDLLNGKVRVRLADTSMESSHV
ncbi:restriction endonuclease subunit S [Citrobacter braakii]|uniref:restriction endonuclease subunit S n=1 Tax=Citrobacter TaxID=544 RepID=UPI0015E983ED|nr:MULTISPECIES: restriction endonuclease subunit S [Citrobacter]EJR7283318.1 restriction endonuclease subunit S [Citrobacter freundii]EKW8512292.1 restriction endonuclease subunit S [Citrobacter freundii]EMB4320677.1 restriction endonuclease subunit S [Citrobacter freundii]MDM3106832.1 restriction endonuclease subunit S [Citrobacter sp. Cf132]MDU4235919.1 restriction endonuclease subunit S [Citrobacter freundii]